MNYVPQGPCLRCGRYPRIRGGLFTVCSPCDDEGVGRGGSESLAERRAASGWTQAPGLDYTAFWVEPPTAYGEPGRMEWRPQKSRVTIIKAPILGEPVNHFGQHVGCRACDEYEQRLVRRVTR